jgi:hypothetical protein
MNAMSSVEYVVDLATFPLAQSGLRRVTERNATQTFRNPFYNRFFQRLTFGNVIQHVGSGFQNVRSDKFQRRQNASEQRTDDVAYAVTFLYVSTRVYGKITFSVLLMIVISFVQLTTFVSTVWLLHRLRRK